MEVVMRTACWLLVGVLGLGFGPLAQADEAEGLTLPRLQGRVKLGMGVETGVADPYGGSVGKLSGASVLGDYYFDRHTTREGDSSGFRATSGVFLGSQLGIWGGPAPVALSGNLFSVERHSFSLLTPPRGAEIANPDSGAVPYVGLGYSGVSPKGGWGFSADLGLMALNPGGAARLGRVIGSGQNLDDALREMRMSPLVQIGASYSF
jgi:hypothetical protein